MLTVETIRKIRFRYIEMANRYVRRRKIFIYQGTQSEEPSGVERLFFSTSAGNSPFQSWGRL